MKSSILLACILLVSVSFALGSYWARKHSPDRFEFYSGADGLLMWRCDRVTGELHVTYTPRQPKTFSFDEAMATNLITR